MSPFNDQIKAYLPLVCAFSGALFYLGFVLYSELVAIEPGSGTNAAMVAAAPAAQYSSQKEKAPDVDINGLAKLHIFGRYAPPAAKVADEQQPVPEPELDLSALPKTKINLKLSGIGYSANDSRASAIIVTPDGQHDHFVIGEEIITNASVHLIERDRVIIKHNGKLEVLELPDANTGNPNGPNRNRRIAKRNDNRSNQAQVTR